MTLDLDMFYVYRHQTVDNGRIFYVGKGSGKRAFSRADRNIHWKRIVNKSDFSVDFICKNVDEELAFLVEKEAISLYKKLNVKLCNMTAGGDGGGSCKPSMETRKKISNSLKGIKKPDGFGIKLSQSLTGKKATEETRLKLSISHLGVSSGAKHGMYGKTHTKEAREKISASKLGVKRSVNVSKRLSEIVSGCFWVTNGIKCKRLKEYYVLPQGWYFGKTSSKGKSNLKAEVNH